MIKPEWYGWLIFFGLIFLMLIIDLGVFNRRAHIVRIKEAVVWTGLWVLISLIFALGLYLWKGTEPSLRFLTGYVVEKALSLDNVFVFVMVFQYFKIPLIYQHRVLFYGILGAILMRGVFIWGGLEIIELFSWAFYVFGLLLIITAIKMMRLSKGSTPSLQDNAVIKFLHRYLPISGELHGQKFLVKENGKWMFTPLFVSLIFIELSDVLFALDSVPAIFAITTDSFLVYTSNIFAILGLRSMYFVLADLIPKFRYLKVGLSLILIFIGMKLICHQILTIPILLSLSVILGTLSICIGLSYLPNKALGKKEASRK